jgi:5-formyltetrahydrofolate cyclo-ligase
VTSQPPNKMTLRRTFLKQRLLIKSEAAQKAAEAVLEAFFREVSAGAGSIIAGYWPIRGELSDLPLLKEIQRRGHPCALPVVTGEGLALSFRAWTDGAPVTAGRYDIAEPVAGEDLMPDILLVPMAAFDTQCHRLGYGGGFYDRTIARLRSLKPVLAVGLAFEEQRCETLPTEENDVRMDMIITERNIYR